MINHYIGPYTIANANITPVQFRVYYVPIQIPYQLRIIEFSVYITTREDDKQARVGIYAYERGIITTSIYNNTIALNTIGVRVVGANVVIQTGTYMFVYYSEATTAVVRKVTIDAPILGYERNDEVTQYTHYIEDKADFSDSLDDDPVVSLVTGDCPHIFAKVG